MSLSLQAKPVVQAIKDELQKEITVLQAAGIRPRLAIIRAGNRPDDIYYENSIIKNCQNIGIEVKVHALAESISLAEFKEILLEANEDREVHGIMIFRPLPAQLDEEELKYLISPLKDVDCMSPLNLAKVFAGDLSGLLPCTPAAVMETLKYYQIKLQGANVVVVGRSMVVGKPVSMMLLKENATVTICHSKTKDLAEICKNADVLVAAMGKARFINEDFVSAKSVVIDVGINDTGDGKICGDVDYDKVKDVAAAITPVPGGIGSVTTTMLLKNIVLACRDILAMRKK